MASTSETGHDIDIANAGKVEEIINGMGAEYQPAEPALERAVLTPQIAAAKLAQDEVNLAKKPYTTAVKKQENLFMGLGALFTKVKDTVETLRIPENRKEEVRSIQKRFQNQKVGKEKPVEEGKEAPKTASVSQRSYTSQVKHLKSLIGTLKEIPEYQPKEEEKKIASLEALAVALEKITQEVDPLETKLINARDKRNKLYYEDTVGLIDTMAAVKRYLITLGKRGKHPAYVEMNRLKFTRKPKPKKQSKK